jgi:UDP-N-acetylglucosamine acyltransferase
VGKKITMGIHQSAIVHENAKIGENVTIEPFAVIGEDVTLGNGCKIGPHVVIDGWTAIGEECQFYPGASIGSPPQDLKYQGEKTRLVIGDHNVFREYVTVNTGTVGGGGETRIGSHCLLMAYTHVAHDCSLGDHVIMANCATLSGHVTIEDYAIIGGLSAVHQFARLGAHCMIGGCSGVAQDVPPYMVAVGERAEIYALNLTGLKRRDFSKDSLKALQKAFRILYRSGLNTKHAVERIKAEVHTCPELERLIEFIEHSERGIASGHKK